MLDKPNQTSAIDAAWMRRALALARRAVGRTSPNPAVGAVLVRDGVVVGEGWTAPPGGPHAEIVALRQAGERARDATLYVTLEPCAHFGRTPPCVDALIAAGIRRAVVAIPDPFPGVSGRGLSRLEAAGIAVTLGIEADAAIALNAGFLNRVRHERPTVTAKYAMTLDGRIATRTGHSRWITGPDARREAHRLRDAHDAILVGIGTVQADDPLLTTRLSESECGDGGPHHPLRVVLDRRARTPLSAAMLRPDTPGQTLIVISEHAPEDAVSALRAAGADVVRLPEHDGQIDLRAMLRLLAERGINSLLVEGGATVHGAFLDADLVDELVAFVAPVVVGGASAPGPVGGVGRDVMDRAPRLKDVETRQFGTDFMISGRLHPLPTLEDLLCSVESSKRSARSSRSIAGVATTH
ncbi:MAG TPA: bifunctional diaminohydroxyphosphoribosylaminopyrimidine deaminase/5-amino-6-(5-phosphoribosylamino)uracil reductase RibD [Nitrolancea sp.]|nr:bifunctional diaminohydroxyphosphoribosylaminopyrimidine deaminase/5-amino-6-(5-phosphoribosylamino)uracil reductase RibD [Nitrolancea sp.]